MRPIYSFLLYVLSPYLLFSLWWKGRRLPAYKQRIAERFSLDRRAIEPVDVWIHAVSLGEVITATPLIDVFLEKKRRVLITTMTPTGAKQVQSRFGDSVAHRYLPYDFPWAINRFLQKAKPKLALIVETELWPNVIHYTNKAKIPLFLLNARLSQGSFAGYKKLAFFFKPLLNRFQCIFAQSDEDANRFKALGAENVEVLGNMKFDLQTKNNLADIGSELKKCWGKERPVLMVASTHEDEEAQILAHLRRLQANIPDLIVLIAPRHPERFAKIHRFSIEQGYKTGLRSKQETIQSDCEVVILDSLGELLEFYRIANYAFVGGSLVPIGGHNVLEPIAMQTPVLSGPYVHNFKTICRDLKEANAILLADDTKDLIEKIIHLHRNKEKREEQVKNATLVLEQHKGAVMRHVDRILNVTKATLS